MLKNFSWLYPLSKPLGLEVVRDAMLNDPCHAERSLPVAFNRVLTEGIFPMDRAGCDADVWVFIKAWGTHVC